MFGCSAQRDAYLKQAFTIVRNGLFLLAIVANCSLFVFIQSNIKYTSKMAMYFLLELIMTVIYNVTGIFIIINYDVVDRPRSYLNNDNGD